MDIEEVGSLQVVGSELCEISDLDVHRVSFCLQQYTHLSKVHLIEHNLIRMSDAPEPRNEGQNGHYGDSELVVPFSALLDRLVWLGLLDDIGDFLLDLLGEGFRVR